MKADLLRFTDNGGCSSKLPPKQLEEILSHLSLAADPDILVNIENHDDAGVYRLNDELALVFTTDFFPPVCSDPFEFGQIAAANSISDIYAMGGKPVLALNIMMFPASRLPMEVYGEIIRGGVSKASEAGVSIIGGHTIDDPTPKYGLAVIGFVNPAEMSTNAGARPGDILILTKPIGTGTILSGQKLGISSSNDIDKALEQMKLLNKSAAEVMRRFHVRCATDITGFGLAGHTLKMAKASGVTVRINMENVPLIGNVMDLTDQGCIPGASFRNLDYAEGDTLFDAGLNYNLKMLAFDAQTSGGLLICVSPGIVNDVLKELSGAGVSSSAVIGNVMEFQNKPLILS